jgi:triphosphatase
MRRARRPRTTVCELVCAVLRQQAARLREHEPGARADDDPAALHDLRVATRRVRAALRLFHDSLPPRSAPRLRTELGSVARALGGVRDLDVVLQGLAQWGPQPPAAQGEGFEQLRTLLIQRRARARRKLLAVLDSRRYADARRALDRLSRRAPGPRTAAAHRLAREAAPRLLQRRYERVRRLGDAVTSSTSDVQLHALRIAGKRLRYALEFHEEVYGQAVVVVVPALVALQDLLGEHQDAVVAQQLLRGLRKARAASGSPPLLAALHESGRRYAARAAELRRQLPALYARIAEPHWAPVHRMLQASARHS